MRIGQVSESYDKQGYVCIVDDCEEMAVRLANINSETLAFLKRKGQKELKSIYSCDTVQEIIHELNNREITLEEYNKY